MLRLPPAKSSTRLSGGFVSGAKDDATALVVLRTMLRKNTIMFAKLQNGKYGLRAWYPNLKATKESVTDEAADGNGRRRRYHC